MSNLFPHVKRVRLGYHHGQVDAFFERARSAYEQPHSQPGFSTSDISRAAFDLKRGGYDPFSVDAALDRLETAFAQRAREMFIREHGNDAWMQDLAQRAQVLYPRLRRPKGRRFRSPHGMRGGYDRKQVDRMLDRITAFFDSGQQLTPEDIRTTMFKRRVKWSAYDERTVDAYLARTVDILLGVA